MGWFFNLFSKKNKDVNGSSVNTESKNHMGTTVELWEITEPVTDHVEINDTWTTNVAGANRRCTPNDVGGIVGYVEAEPTNDYNPNAMGVYLANGKLIGYIAERELEDYRAWSRTKKLPFVGYIDINTAKGFGVVASRIHIIVPKSREFLLDRAGKFYISIKESGKVNLIPDIKDLVVPDRPKEPERPDVEHDYMMRNENWGYCYGYNIRDPKTIPSSTVKYHLSNITERDGYALYRFLCENKGNVIDISRFAKYRNPERDYISTDEQAIDFLTRQLDEFIFCSVATIKWIDLTHFEFELLEEIPINEEWERKRKWKQWLKQA